jgi:hypothetical protein
MTVTRLFTVEAGTVSSGASNEVSETDNESYIIEKVKVLDQNSNISADTDVTIQIGGNSITDQVIPVTELNQDHGDLPVLNLNWPENKQLQFSYTNDETDDITLKFVVYVREAPSDMSDMVAGTVVSTPLGGS